MMPGDQFIDPYPMACPTPCVCGRIVELHEMWEVSKKLPDGGNLVCEDCYCDECGGTGDCGECGGTGACCNCGADCPVCDSGDCSNCDGLGYWIQDHVRRAMIEESQHPSANSVKHQHDKLKRFVNKFKESFHPPGDHFAGGDFKWIGKREWLELMAILEDCEAEEEAK